MRHELAQKLLDTARQVQRMGLVRGTSGNVSVRHRTAMLITPSGIPYETMGLSDVVELDLSGKPRAGRRTPSSEWRLHTSIYQARPDVGAIVHTHSIFATTFSILRQSIPAVHYMIALTGSDAVHCAAYATYGSAELASACILTLGATGACLLANHGLVAVGPDLAAALRVASEIETLAELAWRAMQIGKPVVLDSEEIKAVGDRFESTGYGSRRLR